MMMDLRLFETISVSHVEVLIDSQKRVTKKSFWTQDQKALK
jgi:hypothetical protein